MILDESGKPYPETQIARSIDNPAVSIHSDAMFDYVLGAGQRSASGIVINEQTAIQSPAIFGGIDLVASYVGKTPLLTYQRGEDDGREVDKQHPAFRLLARRAASWLPSQYFIKTLQGHAMLLGNGYAYIYRDRRTGEPYELRLLNPTKTYCAFEDEQPLYITETEDGELIKLPFSDVLHHKGWGTDGIMGLNICDVLKDTLGLGLSLTRYGAVYFKNSGKPGVVIILPEYMTDKEKIEHLRATYGNLHQGLDNAHRPALLPFGSLLNMLPNNNEDAQWLASREFDLKAVALILGLPPHKLGANFSTSYSSFVEQNDAFLADSLDKWFVSLESECTLKLMTERQKDEDSHYCEFLREALDRTDKTKETETMLAELHGGGLSWEEYRRIKNRKTKRTGETYYRLANVVVESDSPEAEPAQPEPQAGATEAPSEPAEAAQEPLQRSDDRLAVLTRSTLQRLLTRIARATERAAGQEDWTDYLATLGEAHRSVWLESLSAFDSAEDVTDGFLNELAEELSSISRSDVPKILERHSKYTIDKLKAKLMGA